MSKSIDIEDFRNKPQKEKDEIIFTALTSIAEMIKSLPSPSLGKNEARYIFVDPLIPTPKGYTISNGQNGTHDPTQVQPIIIQKV